MRNRRPQPRSDPRRTRPVRAEDRFEVGAGAVHETMAINVGARLIAWDEASRVIRIEEAGRAVAAACGYDITVGHVIGDAQKAAIAEKLGELLFEALQRRELSSLARDLVIVGPLQYAGELKEISFSGGVGEYVYDESKPDYGDLGKLFGAAIRRRLGSLDLPLAGSVECIRATVIGASQYTVQVSSSTVFVSRGDLLPRLDLQVIPMRLPGDTEVHTAERVSAGIVEAFARF